MESKGIGIDLDSSRDGRGTWNVGSVSFSGTAKKGSPSKKGRKETKGGSRKIPDFDGKIQSPSVVKKSKEEGESSSDESDLDIAALALADVRVEGGHGKREGAGESQVGLLEQEEDATYSTGVIKRQPGRGTSSFVGAGATSTLTLKGFQAAEEEGAEVTHDRHFSSTSTNSLPSLPPSWIHAEKDANSDDVESPFIDATADNPDIPATESFISARSETISIAGATIDHQDPDEADEENDTFHSTLNFLPANFEASTPVWPLHRFSLIKPSLQRFIVGSIPGVVKSYGNGFAGSNVGLGIAKKSVLEENGNRCQLCEKKLGALKAYLQCDDCGFS